MSMNIAILLGNVGGDPDIKTFQSGGKVAQFSLATSRHWKDKSSGEKKEKTTWHNIVVRNEAIVGIVDKYVRKGTKVGVQGEIEVREYTDREGVKRYITEIVVGFGGTLSLEGGKDGGDGSGERVSSSRKAGESDGGGGSRPSSGRLADQLDDDIPF